MIDRTELSAMTREECNALRDTLHKELRALPGELLNKARQGKAADAADQRRHEIRSELDQIRVRLLQLANPSFTPAPTSITALHAELDALPGQIADALNRVDLDQVNRLQGRLNLLPSAIEVKEQQAAAIEKQIDVLRAQRDKNKAAVLTMQKHLDDAVVALEQAKVAEEKARQARDSASGEQSATEYQIRENKKQLAAIRGEEITTNELMSSK